MRLVRGSELTGFSVPASVLTIGNFDGVHCGHRQILAQAGLFAADERVPVAVLTFEPHPLAVVGSRQAPPRLTTPEERNTLLRQAGADIVVVADSTPALLGLTADAFIDQIVVPRFHPRHVVEGASFGFGRGRKGTTDTLRGLGRSRGFEVFIVEPVRMQVEHNETVLVSSSLIRGLLRDGRVDRAALCLGRAYTLIGVVGQGAQRGVHLGFPTANLEIGDQLVPGDGVYAGEAHVPTGSYPAAISIGSAPTFDGGISRVEAHLLGYSGDLYGQPLRLDFHRPLRAQQRFGSREELIQQIVADVEQVRRLHEDRTRTVSGKERTI